MKKTWDDNKSTKESKENMSDDKKNNKPGAEIKDAEDKSIKGVQEVDSAPDDGLETESEINGDAAVENDDMPDEGLSLKISSLSRKQLAEKLRLSEEQNLRLRAEFANYKKRMEREQFEHADYLKVNIFNKMLPILDDFKQMLEKSNSNENEVSVIEGAKMIYEKFLQILEREGISKIEALGQEFDPNIHEALMMRPTENQDDNDKVIEVFQDGFVLNDRLIRPTKVVVGKYQND